MYLVHRAIDGAEVPHVLPLNIVPPSKRHLFTTQLPSNISSNISVGYNKVSVNIFFVFSHLYSCFKYS